MENPEQASEVQLLGRYAPELLQKAGGDALFRLTGAFGDLRAMVEKGQLSYPYSLRELVHVVRRRDSAVLS